MKIVGAPIVQFFIILCVCACFRIFNDIENEGLESVVLNSIPIIGLAIGLPLQVVKAEFDELRDKINKLERRKS